jgi:palmitoyltransferase
MSAEEIEPGSAIHKVSPIFRYFYYCVRFFISALGWILSSAALSLILLTVYVYLDEVLPSMILQEGMSYSIIVTLIGAWIVFNIIFNFVSCSYVGPGFVGTLDAITIQMQMNDPALRGNVENYRWCGDCQAIKPMRSNHCGLCRRCVLKMDHHCPWVNCCVGWSNQRYFMLFIFYLFVGSIFFIKVDQNMMNVIAKHPANGVKETQAHVVAVIMSLAACFASLLFGGWTTYLLMNNLTTFEFVNASWPEKLMSERGPFSLGTSRNIKEVFGMNCTWYNWFWPSRSLPPGNGCVFPLAAEQDTIPSTP